MVSYDVMILPPGRMVEVQKKNATIGQKTRNLRNNTALVHEGNKMKNNAHASHHTHSITSLLPHLTS